MRLKNLLNKWMPEHHRIKEHPSLRFLGGRLHDPNLWHINRNSTAKAFSVGLFFAFLPMPGQMLLAALGAIVLRANLPISVVLTWISNPLTIAPFVYAAYVIGSFVLQTPPKQIHFELTTAWLLDEFAVVWKPFLLGNVILGLISGTIGNLFIRLLWRLWVVWHWRKRKEGRNSSKKVG